MNKLNIETICDIESFKALRSEWDALLQRSFSNGLFLTWEWIYSWWMAYHSNKELNIICVRKNDNALVGIAPLFIYKTKYYKISVAELTFIADLFSDRQDFIVDKKHPEVYKAIISSILTKTNWEVARFEQVPEWSCLVTDAKGDNRYEIEEASHLPFIKIISDWETFYNGLSSQFKRDLKRKNNVLKREGKWGYKIINQIENIEDELEKFFEIELKSRKKDAGTALFTDDRARYFQQVVSKYCLERGWLNMSCINVNNNPVSYLIGYVYDNKYLAYNTAYLSEYYRASPGKLVLYETIKHCFSKNLSEFDFLRGDTDIKNRWTKTNRTNYRIVFFNKGLKSSILHKAVFVIRPLIKKQMNNKFVNRLINLRKS